MKWRDVLKLAGRCSEALPVAKEALPFSRPPADSEAILLCKDKVRHGESSDECLQADCPKWREAA